jgi:trehalose 6-phosphate synthase
MQTPYKLGHTSDQLEDLCQELLAERRLILVSNRGPVEYRVAPNGELQLNRGTGGVVTALRGISRHVELTWIASTMGEGDRLAASGQSGRFQVALPGQRLYIRFVTSPRNVYHKYYNLFCNPLLWFLQHYMWNSPYTPNVDAKVYDAWDNGYVAVNRAFAKAVIEEASHDRTPPFVMIHDYQLYLVGGYVRQEMPNAILQHFIHIPWPASSFWHLFPDPMRRAILESLCAADIVGLQTNRDVHYFLHSCEMFLDGAKVDYESHTVVRGGRKTQIASYPVSVDLAALHRIVRSPRVQEYEEKLRPYLGEQTIVRVDRAEPSKNIARGLKSFDMLLERYPQFVNKIKLICFVVPSRSGIKQYERYTQEIFDSVEALNAKYGREGWQPVRLFFENNYAQSIAGMRLYDVLLVNPVIDGMNLVAKEGPIVNARNGVLVLSESAGAYEQLKENVIAVAPADLEGTTQALYEALTMDPAGKKRRIEALRKSIEEEDIMAWLYHQFRDLRNLACQLPLLLCA